MNTKPFITAEQAAKILLISTSTLYFYAKEGKIPAYRIAKSRLLFKEEELLEYIKQSKITPIKKEPIKLPEEPRIKAKPVTCEEVLNRLKKL